MGSSFLTSIYIGLSLYCLFNFVRFSIQFGLPNHPLTFTLYFQSLSATAYFTFKFLMETSAINLYLDSTWTSFPQMILGLGLFVQVLSLFKHLSQTQKKILTRLPLIGAILVNYFSREWAGELFTTAITLGFLMLVFLLKKERYRRRQYFKMAIFLLVVAGFRSVDISQVNILGELFFIPSLFYFFNFQQTFGVTALVERKLAEAHA